MEPFRSEELALALARVQALQTEANRLTLRNQSLQEELDALRADSAVRRKRAFYLGLSLTTFAGVLYTGAPTREHVAVSYEDDIDATRRLPELEEEVDRLRTQSQRLVQEKLRLLQRWENARGFATGVALGVVLVGFMVFMSLAAVYAHNLSKPWDWSRGAPQGGHSAMVTSPLADS